MALIAGGLVVAAIIGVIVLATTGKKEPKKTLPPAVRPSTSLTEKGPSGPTKLPPPTIPQSLRDKADAIVQQARPLAEQGEEAYKVALTAKESGNDELWQEKLHEASTFFGEINDLYNELIMEIDAGYTNRDWDAEQVANHYLGSQARTISQYLRRYQDIRKQRVR